MPARTRRGGERRSPGHACVEGHAHFAIPIVTRPNCVVKDGVNGAGVLQLPPFRPPSAGWPHRYIAGHPRNWQASRESTFCSVITLRACCFMRHTLAWRCRCPWDQAVVAVSPVTAGRRVLEAGTHTDDISTGRLRIGGDMTLHLHYWPTPNGKKVAIFLEEAGLDYKIIPCDIGRGDQFAPDFLKLNPNNRMPVLPRPPKSQPRPDRQNHRGPGAAIGDGGGSSSSPSTSTGHPDHA